MMTKSGKKLYRENAYKKVALLQGAGRGSPGTGGNI